MGCLKLHIDTESTLSVAYRKKGQKPSKNTGSYYPFGLEHKGYNNVVNGTENNYKQYQGQEWTQDLGLNWHEWKYRMSYPDIGRFISVDPLAESFVYNSTYAFAENKLGLGTELEGAELNLHPWLVTDAVKNPNGVGAHTLGISQGLANTVTDAVDFVTTDAWKASTWKGLGNLALGAVVSGGNPTGGLNVGNLYATDAALGTNTVETMAGVSQALDNAVNDVVNGNGIERGTVIGEVLGAAIGTKGTTAATKGITTAIKANKSTKVFRVFGGDAKADGFSWTPTDPRTVNNFRDAAGLPSGGASGATNTAEFLIQGTVKNKNIIKKRAALPLDGNRGGLPEYIIDPNNVKVKLPPSVFSQQ